LALAWQALEPVPLASEFVVQVWSPPLAPASLVLEPALLVLELASQAAAQSGRPAPPSRQM
jgi:hypothetical protein